MPDGTSVGSLYYDLSIDDKNLKGQLDNADSSVKSFSTKLHDGLNKAAAGFAVVGAGLTLIAKNATDFTVNLVKSSKALGTQIGVSTSEASRLVAAFGRMGVSAESASQVFGIFSKNISKATQDAKDSGLAMQKVQIDIDKTKLSITQTTAEITKNGDKTGELSLKLRDLNNTLATQQAALTSSGNAFQKLGISTVDAQGNQKGFNTILFEVADKFKAMPNGIDKTTSALELFGRSGKDMIKVLNLGSDGIQQLEKDADKLGLTLTAKNIGQINDYIKSQKDLKQQTDELKIKIGETTAPVLTEFNKKINEIIQSLMQTDGPLKTLTTDTIAFGGPAFTAAAGAASFASSIAQVGGTIGFAALGTIGLITLAVVAGAVAWGLLLTHLHQVHDFLNTDLGMAVQAALVVMMPFVGIPLEVILHWQGIKDFFIGLFGWISQNWPYIAGILISPFAYALGAVIGIFNSLKSSILGFVSDAGHWLYNAGRDIINGMVQGIKDKIGDAVNAVKYAGEAIIKGMRVAIGWHSPAKMFIEAGQSIGQGMAIGIKSSAGLALSAMDALGNNVISPQFNMAGAGASGGGATTNMGNTIVNIGTVQDRSDADYILRRLDRNQQLAEMSVAPQ